MQLETERLILTQWHPEDFDAFRPIATDPEVMRFIMKGKPWPNEMIHDFIRRQRAKSAEAGYCRWKLLLKGTGELIGFCGPGTMHDMEHEELGWWLAKHMWGQGLATEAARAALKDAFERVGLARLVSVAHRDNLASIHVMQKIGLTFLRETLHHKEPSVVYTLDRETYLK